MAYIMFTQNRKTGRAEFPETAIITMRLTHVYIVLWICARYTNYTRSKTDSPTRSDPGLDVSPQCHRTQDRS